MINTDIQQSPGGNKTRGLAWKRSLRWLGLVFSGILILVAIAECGLRVLLGDAYFSPPIFNPAAGNAPYGLASDRFSRIYQFGRVLDVNSDQSGNRLTVNAASNAAVKLHVIGDSQVFGWGLSDQETVASQLQQMLGSRIQVVNHGVPGYGSFDYLYVLKKIPVNEAVMVLHTEENDTWDAYRLFRSAYVQCGYLVTYLDKASPIRCGMMNSRTVQGVFELWDRFQHWHRPTPLGFSPHSAVVASVLNKRIDDSYSSERKRRGHQLMFSIVPWKARYSSEWLLRYSPALALATDAIPTPFADDAGMLNHFAKHPNSASLYLDGDSHLSPDGARYLAKNLVELAIGRLSVTEADIKNP